jgi:hypothetical protein
MHHQSQLTVRMLHCMAWDTVHACHVGPSSHRNFLFGHGLPAHHQVPLKPVSGTVSNLPLSKFTLAIQFPGPHFHLVAVFFFRFFFWNKKQRLRERNQTLEHRPNPGAILSNEAN